MIKDLAHFEKEPDEVTVTVEELIEDGFTRNLFKTILALSNDQIIGIALYYPRYSTWKGRTIHLEDFIVKESFRKNGIGQMLFDQVVRDAKDFGAKRLEWCVLNWNEPARKFYQKLGAELDNDWELGKLREGQLATYPFQKESVAER